MRRAQARERGGLSKVKCHTCGGRGHFARVCPSKKLENGSKQNRGNPKLSHITKGNTGVLQSTEDNRQLYILKGNIDGLEVKCLIDCGASKSFISSNFVARNNLRALKQGKGPE